MTCELNATDISWLTNINYKSSFEIKQGHTFRLELTLLLSGQFYVDVAMTLSQQPAHVAIQWFVYRLGLSNIMREEKNNKYTSTIVRPHAVTIDQRK